MKRNKSIVIGAILGLVYGLFARYLFDIDEGKKYIEIMSIAFIFIVPLVLGAITVYYGTEAQKKSRAFQMYAPWITVFAFLITNLVTQMEALICVVMLLPAFMISASVGGIIMGILAKSRKSSKILSISLFLPFAFGLIEANFHGNKDTSIIMTEVIIAADKNDVWHEIKSIQDIKEEELMWTFSHFIGIPRPINAQLSHEGKGGTRKITWDRGIEFTEHITHWVPRNTLGYDIEIDTIPVDAVDKHIEVGGKYFDILSGGYQLDALNPSQTKLTLHTKYALNTHFNFYSKFWADLILDDFHKAILNVAKNRVERQQMAEN